MTPPAAILTDIEGTTTPIAFVHRVLFPFARQRLGAFVADPAPTPEAKAALDEVGRLAPGRSALDALLGWTDTDAKIPPLKTIQGLIWREGYRDGALRSEVYPDVAPCLRAWRESGAALSVYSSGSAEAQQLLFGNTPEGDITSLFDHFFDTSVGPKRAVDSYTTIATAWHMSGGDILFLSDIEAELDAAAEAGLRTCQLVRPDDGTTPSARHVRQADFGAVADHFGLPRGG